MAVGDGSTELEDEGSKPTEQELSSNDLPVITPQTSGQDGGDKTDASEEGGEGDEGDEDDDDEDDEEEEEPRLKYATLTKNLGSLYRNGDTTSACLVAGDKMIVGTNNGNIHVFSMPSLRILRTYRAHQPTVTAISISPYLSSLAIGRLDATQRLAAISAEPATDSSQGSPNSKRTPQQQPAIPRTHSNDIYIASSSIDGNVVIASLIDQKDFQSRNFGRPVQAVALSPEYKSDRSYLSGGQAGSLILTIGGQKGKAANATTTGAAATASSWLGSIGLGSNTGTDKVLHSGEGIISTIKWSPSGKYVLWVNEQGIKIMRSNLHLGSGESHHEWKRISHINRPESEESLGWRARVEWIDRHNLDSEDDTQLEHPHEANGNVTKQAASDLSAGIEEVIVGWGDQIWLIRVKPSKGSSSKNANSVGTAEIAANLKLGDCIISGVSMYTQNILIVLAYMEKKAKAKTSSDEPRKGRMLRRNGLKPELRLIDMNTKEELESDLLPVSRFETISSPEYHLAVLPPIRSPAQLAQRGYLGTIGSGVSAVGSGLYTGVETVGQGVWDATMYGPRRLGATRLFSSGESVMGAKTGPEPTPSVKERNLISGWIPGLGSSLLSKDDEQLTSIAVSQGMKIFIYSPFDTVVAIRRNLIDRLQWLIETKHYQKAWELLDEHPEAAGQSSGSQETTSSQSPSKASSTARSGSVTSHPPPQATPQNTLAEFFADSASVTSSQAQGKGQYSSAEKEKRRVGEMWLQQLVTDKQWTEAGEVAEKVLNTTTRWEYWVWKFIRSQKFDEIAFHVPTFQITPPLPSRDFEIILNHYVSKDRRKFKELLDLWPSDLFDISSITAVIIDQIKADNVRKGSDDWCMLQECLAKLYLADGHYKEALRCYISLQDADTAMSLMKEHHLVDAIADDISGFVLLRIPPSQVKTSSKEDLEELSSDSIKILVDEATHGIVEIDDVIAQLQSAHLEVFLFFYLRALWRGEGTAQSKPSLPTKGRTAATTNLAADEGKALVEVHADTAVELFAEYDRDLLMQFLHISTSYTYEKALKICEKCGFIEEQVYLLSKTGAMKKALFLIIDELQDVTKAIHFAKDQGDEGLWNDLLDYSMSRPKIISGLLAEVGTAINPIELVKRIPSGLEIEGLKDGLMKMLREYDIQDSISSGAARVLSSEVAAGMNILRDGRRQGIKFDIPKRSRPQLKPRTETTATMTEKHEESEEPVEHEISPGHCAACDQAFTAHETETLIGFACGHVYHVSHLLRKPGEAENEHELSLPNLNKEEDDDVESGFTSGFTRSVAVKVTNARLLKDKVEATGGCKICKERKDAVPDT